jgi:hypothetical protein
MLSWGGIGAPPTGYLTIFFGSVPTWGMTSQETGGIGENLR